MKPNITDRELSCNIDLAPRAVVLSGSLKGRSKKSDAGVIAGFTPHFACRGCPVGVFDPSGEFNPTLAEGLCIEADFDESSAVGMSSTLSSYGGRSMNMVHLAFGRSGVAPNVAEAKALREAGDLFRGMTGQPAFLVALPILTAGQYGVALGRFYPLGLFRTDGEPIWIHPAAQANGFLTCPIPQHQKQRSLDPGPAFSAPAPDLYTEIHERMKAATGKSGIQLHNEVIAAYSSQLILSGQAKTQAEATNTARDAYERFKKANADASAATTTPAQAQKPASGQGTAPGAAPAASSPPSKSIPSQTPAPAAAPAAPASDPKGDGKPEPKDAAPKAPKLSKAGRR